MSVIMQENMFYIGKIIKEKTNLFDRPVIEKGFCVDFYDSMKDTYGNTNKSILLFEQPDYFITFNAGREYSHFKRTAAMLNGYNGKGELQITAGGNIIYTSPEVTNMTEPFEIEIQIN